MTAADPMPSLEYIERVRNVIVRSRILTIASWQWRTKMVGAIITFFVLFGLIKTFERKRDDLDNFNIATVAIVPILSVILVSGALAFFYPNPTLQVFLPPLVLIGTTFALLWKNLEIPVGRSIGYTVAVVVVNELLAYVFARS
jgi:nitrate reductase NapE component